MLGILEQRRRQVESNQEMATLEPRATQGVQNGGLKREEEG